MIKVKKSFIEKVICFGMVGTRNYLYCCDGRVELPVIEYSDFSLPFVYVVYRLRRSDPGDQQSNLPKDKNVEIVGLFDVRGNRY